MNRRTYTLKTVADVPFDAYPEYPVGPALVAVGDWCVSTTSGAHMDGVEAGAFQVVSERPYATRRHPLDGQMFPTREAARQAQYEAGVLAFMVYDDSRWA